MANTKRPPHGMFWLPAETRIAGNAARRLIDGRCLRLSVATEECMARLREWYAARPEAPESDRVYPRTISSVRNKVYSEAVLRGYDVSKLLWTAPERRLAYRWAKKFLRHQKDRPPLSRLDAGRGMLTDLFIAGYDRSLDGCTMELDKCLRDIMEGTPRHCGRGSHSVPLPASVLPGKTVARRAVAPRWTAAFGAAKSKAGMTKEAARARSPKPALSDRGR
jgi:hypothetical protein